VVVCNKSWKNDQCATNPRGRAGRSMDKIHPTATSNQSQDNLSWAKVCRLRRTRRSRRSRKPRVKVSTGFLSQNPLGESADIQSLRGIASGISVTSKNHSTRMPVAEVVTGTGDKPW
jgi:hypothetical protein